MFEEVLIAQLVKYIGKELQVAVGEELITGVLEFVNSEFIKLIESTDSYERETKTRIIILSRISYIQVSSDNISPCL